MDRTPLTVVDRGPFAIACVVGWLTVVTCALCGPATPPGDRPHEAAVTRVTVDTTKRTGTVSPYLAGANVNDPSAMLIDRDDWHAAVRRLGIRMMRFQVPIDRRLDYRERETWDDADFAKLDEAVRTARERWGVSRLMFGVHRVTLPVTDGKLITDDFDDYADALALMVRRYASPGNVTVEYWEPFNELDHSSFLKKLQQHGQSFADVARLYSVCARRMKAVNPAIKVGGPAAMWPGGWETRMMLQAEGSVADFVSWHQYPTGDASTPDAAILAKVLGPKGYLAGHRRMQDVARAHAPGQDLGLYLSEYHINYSMWKPVDVRGATALTAVFASSVLLNLGREGLDGALIHDVLARHYGLLGPASGDGLSRREQAVRLASQRDPIHVRPVGWALMWFNRFVIGAWVECTVTLPAPMRDDSRGPLLEAGAVAAAGHHAVVLVHRGTDAASVDLRIKPANASTTGAYDLPVRVLSVDDSGARDMRVQGPFADGHMRLTTPPMSVLFVVVPVSD